MRILCIGAYYYGNFGDRSYTWALQDVLGQDNELTFINDVTFPEEVDASLYDGLIIGGGGLLTHDRFCSGTKCTILPIARLFAGKPIALTSVGFQSKFALSLPPYDDIEGFEGLSELMNMCSAIYVRSPADLERTQKIVNNEHVDLFWGPDLVYARDMPVAVKGDDVANVLLLPTGTFSVENTHKLLLARLSQLLLDGRTPGSLYICNFGGDENKDAIQRIVERDRPYIEEPTEALGYKIALITQDEADKLLAARDLSLIITGRYHGLVYGRKLGIPVTTLGSRNYKFEADLGNVLDDPAKLAREAMGRVLVRMNTQIPEDVTKNSVICDLGAESGSVPFLQSLPFIELYYMLMDKQKTN